MKRPKIALFLPLLLLAACGVPQASLQLARQQSALPADNLTDDQVTAALRNQADQWNAMAALVNKQELGGIPFVDPNFLNLVHQTAAAAAPAHTHRLQPGRPHPTSRYAGRLPITLDPGPILLRSLKWHGVPPVILLTFRLLTFTFFKELPMTWIDDILTELQKSPNITPENLQRISDFLQQHKDIIQTLTDDARQTFFVALAGGNATDAWTALSENLTAATACPAARYRQPDRRPHRPAPESPRRVSIRPRRH